MLNDKPFTFDRVVRLALAAGLAWGAILVLDYLSPVLVPFAVALVLAYLLNPLTGLIQRAVKVRGIAVVLTLLALIVVGGLAAWVILPMVVAELTHMGSVVADFARDSDLAREAAKRLPPDLWQAARDIFQSEQAQRFLSSDGLADLAKQVAAVLLPGIWDLVAGTWQAVMALTGVILIGLYMVFLLIDFDKVRGGWTGLLPVAWRGEAQAFAGDFEDGMQRYFRGQALVAACMGVLFAVGLSIVGLPLAILMGLFIGLLNLVPYLQILGMIPCFGLAAIQALETGAGFWDALLPVAGVFLVCQLIQDLFLTPRIIGKQMGLSPWVILLALSIWGQLLGILGLLIALPMTVLCLAWYRRLLAKAKV